MLRQQPTATSSSGSSGKRRRQFENNLERLQSLRPLSRLGTDLLRELSKVSFYEDLTPGIVLFREGDLASCWYVLLSGAVNIVIGGPNNLQDSAVSVQTLSAGSVFGESPNSFEPHCCTALVRAYTELLRVDQRDFVALWRRHSGQLQDVITLLGDIISHTVTADHSGKSRFNDEQEQVNENRRDRSHEMRRSSANHTRADQTLTNHVPNNSEQQQTLEPPDTNDQYHSDGEAIRRRSQPRNRVRSNDERIVEHAVQVHREQEKYCSDYSDNDTNPRPSTQFLKPGTSRETHGYSDSEASPRSNARVYVNDDYYSESERVGHRRQRPRVYSDGSRLNRRVRRPVGRLASDGDTYRRVEFAQHNNIYDTPPGREESYVEAGGAPEWQPKSEGERPAASMIELSNPLAAETKLMHASFVLRSVMLLRSPTLIRDRKFHLVTYSRCMVGTEMVDWLMQQRNAEQTNTNNFTRLHAVGMWQAVLEQGALMHVTHEYPFLDKYLFYRWTEDNISTGDMVRLPTSEQQYQAETELPNVLKFLGTVGPDALFRMVLQKPTYERTPEELELVYEELLHVKALSHLSTMVKRELSAVIVYEQHSHAGTILFNQGDEGKSWYIILKGSVNVAIHGKGVVCTLHEGDDFGKLALVNDAPRAASIILREDNCQFLRVDKHDFNHILRDVEANTVRLKEHGQDVLVLEKIPVRSVTNSNEQRPPMAQQHRYSVMAGKPEKMLEYLLETRIDSQHDDRVPDTFLEDFILTHIIFMPSNVLSNSLKVYYQQGCPMQQNFGSDKMAAAKEPANEQVVACKRRVISFLRTWIAMVGLSFFQDPVGTAFIEELYCAVLEDSRTLSGLVPMVAQMESLMAMRDRAMQMQTRRPVVILDCSKYRPETPSPVMPFDLCIFRVYNNDHAYFTLKARVSMSAEKICQTAAARFSFGTGQGVELVEVTSAGKRIGYNPKEVSVPTMLTLNGNLFISFKDQIDCLVPCAEQEGPVQSVHSATLELLSNSEIAYQLAVFHWQLLYSTHESELIVQMIGRDKFPGRIATNLDLVVRRFKEVQFWTTTEVMLCPQLSKRVALVRKFIKIAVHSKSMNDLLAFFAIILGLSDVSVSRLQLTWEKLPSKMRRQFFEFQDLLNPSRNHRVYRVMVSELQPPVVPFIPLLLKDLRFADDGSKTYYDGLVNFEKMSTIAQTLRTFRLWKSKPFRLSDTRASVEAQQLISNLNVIDDQRRLMYLSQMLEPPKK